MIAVAVLVLFGCELNLNSISLFCGVGRSVVVVVGCPASPLARMFFSFVRRGCRHLDNFYRRFGTHLQFCQPT